MARQQSLFTEGQSIERSHQAEQSIITSDATAPPSREVIANVKARVLDFILRKGTCTCKEIETEFHRGQAPIRELGVDGHMIDTVRIDGRSVYVYRGFERRIRITDRLRALYYESDHWKRTAAERKSVDGSTCSQCGDRESLETHHWRYDLFNEDVLFDLQTLCRSCHERLHQRLRGSKIHFPRSVPPVIARELGCSA